MLSSPLLIAVSDHSQQIYIGDTRFTLSESDLNLICELLSKAIPSAVCGLIMSILGCVKFLMYADHYVLSDEMK